MGPVLVRHALRGAAGGARGLTGYDDRPITERQVALIDLLDRLLSGGVVLTGDLVLSIADIDLVRISLRAVIIAIREQTEEQWAPILPPGSPTEVGGHHDEPF